MHLAHLTSSRQRPSQERLAAALQLWPGDNVLSSWAIASVRGGRPAGHSVT